MFPTYQVIFYFFAIILIAAATMVITSRNPVRSVLFLVLAFFCSAVLWLMIQAEFLALVLIFVYVGAVMTLFLFVVMMLNIDLSKLRERFVRFLPIALVVVALLVGMMLVALVTEQAYQITFLPFKYAADFSNTKQMGTLLFTRYLYEFELAAVILLVAIISAIALAFHGRKPGTKSQRIAEQHKATKRDRLRIIKMKSEGQQ